MRLFEGENKLHFLILNACPLNISSFSVITQSVSVCVCVCVCVMTDRNACQICTEHKLMLQAMRLKQADEGDDIDVEKDDHFNASDGKDLS